MEGTVRQVLQRKGARVHTVEHNTSLFDCAQTMVDSAVGSLVVMSEGNVMGILHERDISRVAVVGNMDMHQTKIGDIMIKKFAFVDLDTSIFQAMSIISKEAVRHLPVIENNELLGVVSIGDLNQWILDLQQEDIGQLVSYIQGSANVSISHQVTKLENQR